MKILTFYFSGSGNTQWVIHQLDSMFRQSGYISQCAAIEEIDMAEYIKSMTNAFDYIGFAYPLYGANIPRIMRGRIRQFLLAARNNPAIPLKLFLINTFAYVNGHGVFQATKLLRHTPFGIIAYLNIKMPNSAPQKRNANRTGQFIADDNRKRKAVYKLTEFVKRLEHGKTYINGVGPHLFVGKVIRRVLRKAIANNYQKMHVDLRACTKCMQCVRRCPVQCIQYQNGAFIFSSACEACMRCYHGCPAHAISND
ncbi:MAG: EFR1 family ferrodoxin [Bacillota bacterium]